MTVQGFYEEAACSLDEFAQLTRQTLDPGGLEFTSDVVRNVPVYDSAQIAPLLSRMGDRQAVLAEWSYVLGKSAGVLALKGAYADTGPLDAATAAYEAIIAKEAEAGAGAGDHFAKSGANARIWNSLQKLCEADPDVFARYFGNPLIDAVCEAWLGPGYQMTAQVNLVRPGGAAQEAHRDYHLGFQTSEIAGQFPAHVHDLSAVMTLQGAVAHCDMPIESGPTKLLPFSQLYRPGYMAYRRADFRAFFEENCVQVPLEKGDAVFFNPALFHAAGENRSTDIQRMANLLQVSSAFGRAMESVDRAAMVKGLYPAVKGLLASGEMAPADAAAAIACAAEGYSFPTNLDSDPPVGGLAPETQRALFHRALREGMSPEDFATAVDAQTARRQP